MEIKLRTFDNLFYNKYLCGNDEITFVKMSLQESALTGILDKTFGK